MKHAWVSMAVFCAVTPVLCAQQAAGSAKKENPPAPAGQVTVTKSLSNIKNNIAVAQNPNGSLKCVAGDQPCSKEQVKALSDAATSRMHILKGNTSSMVATLELGPDGSLVCTTGDGKKCAAAQVTQLNNTAATMPAANDASPAVGIAPGNGKSK